jgi:hypothetical protein
LGELIMEAYKPNAGEKPPAQPSPGHQTTCKQATCCLCRSCVRTHESSNRQQVACCCIHGWVHE